MPLASEQNNVVSTRLSNRRRNRLPTTADFDSAGGRRHDGPADFSGVFGTGIVICDDDMIGKIHRDLTHFRPLTCVPVAASRSEEHTSELQSLMRISYAVFCLKNKTT